MMPGAREYAAQHKLKDSCRLIKRWHEEKELVL